MNNKTAILMLLLTGIALSARCSSETRQAGNEAAEVIGGVQLETVQTPHGFEQWLLKPNLVIHVDVEWSTTAIASRPVVRAFSRSLTRTPKYRSIAVCRIDCSEQRGPLWDSFGDWLREQGADTSVMVSGHGAVLWVRSGRVVDAVHSAEREGVDRLVKRTDQAFEIDDNP
jgi:hypothetical protein